MSGRTSSYEDFLNLPRRVFLDSSVLQNVHKYGEILFDNQELKPEARIWKWEEGPAEINALRNIFVVSQRAEFQFAVSRNSLKEVAGKEDSAFLGWARNMLRYWEECLAWTGVPNSSKAESICGKLDTESFAYLSAGDRALLRDAVIVACDAFLTMDFKLRKNSSHLEQELKIRVLSPNDYWKLLMPWAALYV
jgi:hypothetical protein